MRDFLDDVIDRANISNRVGIEKTSRGVEETFHVDRYEVTKVWRTPWCCHASSSRCTCIDPHKCDACGCGACDDTVDWYADEGPQLIKTTISYL